MERFLGSRGSIFTLLILLVFLTFSLSACSGLTVKKDASPKEVYLAALTEFNDTVEDYNEQYRLQSPVIQADWKEKIDPWIKKASLALGTWGIAVSENASTTDKIEAFEKLKNMLIAILILEGIKINEGK